MSCFSTPPAQAAISASVASTAKGSGLGPGTAIKTAACRVVGRKNAGFTMENGGFTIENDSLTTKHGGHLLISASTMGVSHGLIVENGANIRLLGVATIKNRWFQHQT